MVTFNSLNEIRRAWRAVWCGVVLWLSILLTRFIHDIYIGEVLRANGIKAFNSLNEIHSSIVSLS